MIDDDFDEVPPYASDGFHTLASARYAWEDGDTVPDTVLRDLLEIAAEQCIAFAPVKGYALPYDPSSGIDGGDASGAQLDEPGTGTVPTRYRVAQLMQARNIWNSSMAAPDTGDFGGNGFALTPKPLDWIIKQILRPKRGKPVIF